MLSYETMGTLCLLTLWSTALLVAGAAWQDLRDVWALYRRAKGALRASVESAPEGALAEWRVAQRGRALDSRGEAIAFHDREFESTIADGEVRVGGVVYRVKGPGEVWATRRARSAAAACKDRAAFDAAYKEATRAAGWQREVRVGLSVGDELFVLGEVKGDEIVGGEAGLVLAGFDPAPQLGLNAALLSAFIVVELAACAAVTWVAVPPPHFGLRGVAGAILGLAFFLGVTPVAVALREHVRRPSIAYQRGTWSRASVG
jgi:hypothetical protein